MPVFTVHHTTTYRYRQPVGFGAHRLMLRPMETRDQELLAAELSINPEPASLEWAQDELGNWVGTARFRGRAKTLCFHATISVDQTPWHPDDASPEAGPRLLHTPASSFSGLTREHRKASEVSAPGPRVEPCSPEDDRRDGMVESHRAGPGDIGENGLQPFLRRTHRDPDGAVLEWARSFLAAGAQGDALATLVALNGAIHSGFAYVRREEKGIQEPALTVSMRAGSCRDYAVLMMEAARALDIPARFVTGYLHVPERASGVQGGGSTHAWVQAWLPGIGWTDFDPTNGIVGNENLIRVAAAPEPAEVLPLSGTFIGFAADRLGMEVSVRVESGGDTVREARCGVAG